jgi:hypothetical protein
VRPLFHEPSEHTAAPPPPPPSRAPISPTITSHSSTSLKPQPTVSSIYSSRHGSGFIPSHHTSPALAQRESTPSKSISSSTSWNPFAVPNTPVSDIKFVPETNFEIEFFPRIKPADKDTLDMKSVWTMIEERKQEEQHLCAEFGWGSQSGISASQTSLQPQRCQNRDGLSDVYGQQSQNDVDGECSPITSKQEELFQAEGGRIIIDTILQDWKQTRPTKESSLREESTGLQSPSEAELVRRIIEPTSFEQRHSTSTEINLSSRTSMDISGSFFKDKEDEKLGHKILQEQHGVYSSKDLEDEEENEDEGIPWF